MSAIQITEGAFDYLLGLKPKYANPKEFCKTIDDPDFKICKNKHKGDLVGYHTAKPHQRRCVAWFCWECTRHYFAGMKKD